jgi:hypothetical protein
VSAPTRISRGEPEIVRRDLDDLLLDPENPRLTVQGDATQEQLLKMLWRNEALEELAPSLSTRYFTEEPVVVVASKKPKEKGKYVVVEGNRRVATLKLLLRPSERTAIGATAFPQVKDKARVEALETVPTVEYATREEIVPYLGFRHITGVRTWNPYAKARYVAGLVEAGTPLLQIEQAVGDTAKSIKRLYRNYVIYRQLVGTGYKAKNIDSFSLLEVMIGQAKIQNYLNMPRGFPEKKTSTVIPNEFLPRLREVASYVFGDSARKEDAVITESRQISKELAPVIGDDSARTVLQKTRDLSSALESIGGEVEVLLKKLRSLGRTAKVVLPLLPTHKTDATIRAELRKIRPHLRRVIDAAKQ